jgi:Family of unknown function (DUF6353)
VAIADLLKQGQEFARQNQPGILTGLGVAGVVATAYLTGRASFKAAEIIYDEELALLDGAGGSVVLPTKERVRLTWTQFIVPVGVGGITIGCVVWANHESSRRTAAMAALYGLSERAFSEYKEKVMEKMGENKERALRDELAQDRVNNNPVTKEVIIAGSGEVLCYENLTGRYFMSSVEEIKKAQNEINHELINHMYVSLSAFYDKLGLPPTRHSDEVGWNTNNLLDVTFSTTLSKDQKPCLLIDFAVGPRQDYTNLY